MSISQQQKDELFNKWLSYEPTIRQFGPLNEKEKKLLRVAFDAGFFLES